MTFESTQYKMVYFWHDLFNGKQHITTAFLPLSLGEY